ncbi:hypothetical protein CDV55_102112 [Aspergillus turcosus]|nr:hypothetical protein CDV55_102112 [Aspergillus turcosus]
MTDHLMDWLQDKAFGWSHRPPINKVDTHHHFVPPIYRKAYKNAAVEDAGGDPSGWTTPQWTATRSELLMDRLGVRTAILSVTAPGACILKGAASFTLARQVNEYAAELRDRNPQRFGFFASLPSLLDTDAALSEITYALDTLHADGVTLFTRYGDSNVYLGHPSLEPIWAELDRRKCVVFVHPTHPLHTTPVNPKMPPPVLDFPHETTRSAMDMILQGTRSKYPNCKVILSHAGGALPYLISRVATPMRRAPDMAASYRIGTTYEQVMRDFRSFYYDLALSSSPQVLDMALKMIPRDHLLFGSDFPYAPATAYPGFLEDLESYEMEQELRDMINFGNAIKLIPRLARGDELTRRKIALACEPCRERKSRCDGQKPICGPCERRCYTIDRCIFKADNARSASNDEYIRALHQRIRDLEEACRKAGVSVLPPGAEDVVAGSLEEAAAQTPLVGSSRPHQVIRSQAATYCSPHSDIDPVYLESPSVCSNVTAMGAINSVCSPVEQGAKPLWRKNEYFGSSSTASMVRLLARGSLPGGSSPVRTSQHQPRDASPQGRGAWPPSRVQVEGFLLPPRDLADHLLECFWDRVYCLYPFFDRASFQDAYDNLWLPKSQSGKSLSELDIGLGSKADSGPRSLVFVCALNVIFALGCHFARDIPVTEREAVSYTFLLRAKQHIGLDMLDLRTTGVVQTLLIVALYLQSTPFPHRCWNSIGVACRIAQGLGLHEEQLYEQKSPLEQEIQRRTWHGCVMMDMIVSMTYGRPSMTSHLPSVPLPETGEEEHSSGTPSPMTFYISTIELYRILDSILSDIYGAWRGHSSHGSRRHATKHGGLDVIIELEEKLSEYENNLPHFLDWNRPLDQAITEQLTLQRQRNVLRARYLYLRLLLYRPILTQLCSESVHPRTQADKRSSSLYASILSKCAAACVRAAIDLVSYVHETYHTSATDPWWYNGFYTSTAGMVLIMSSTCDTILADLEASLVHEAWSKCEEILTSMSLFSVSARNTLLFLRAARTQVMAENGSHVDGDRDRDFNQSHQEQRDGQLHLQENAFVVPDGLFPSYWDASADELELGFLGPFEYGELQGWLGDGS